MSEAWTKLFHSITASTIWSEPNATRICWITMLAIADRDGYVGASIPGLATIARLTIEEVEIALAAFQAPDKYSRNQAHEGRRIETAPRGWTILNYGEFRDLRDEDARREFERERKRKQRSRHVRDKLGQTGTVPQCPKMSRYVDVDVDVDVDPDKALPSRSSVQIRKEKQITTGTLGVASDPPSGAVWIAYANAYRERYHVDPVRNRKVNSQLAQLVQRLGVQDAAHVAQWYVSSDEIFYVRVGHAVGVLLKDAEKLRTEWATQSRRLPIDPLIEHRRINAEHARREREVAAALASVPSTTAPRVPMPQALRDIMAGMQLPEPESGADAQQEGVSDD